MILHKSTATTAIGSIRFLSDILTSTINISFQFEMSYQHLTKAEISIFHATLPKRVKPHCVRATMHLLISHPHGSLHFILMLFLITY